VSAGAGPAVGALPAPAPRTRALADLERELFHARDAHEYAYAAQIEARMARLSQGSAADPRKETRTRRNT
jgi:hypothetical protein